MMFLFKLLARLPLPLLHALGIALGWLVYWAPGRHSGRLRSNLLDKFASAIRASGARDQDVLIREYQRVLDLLGNINLKEDEYCSAGEKRIVIDCQFAGKVTHQFAG